MGVIDYAALKTEITTDPNGYGYAAPFAAGSTIGVADILNTPRAGISIDLPSATAAQMQSQVVGAEFAALPTGKQIAWQCILACGEIPIDNANLRAQIAEIWGGGTTTRANLLAIQTRIGSRAEQLFGFGVVIGHLDVAKARDL